MTNTQQVITTGKTIVLAGKVRGYLYTTVATDGTVHRCFKPKYRVSTKTRREEQQLKIHHLPYSVHKQEPAVKPVTKLDVPQFMKERSNEMYRKRTTEKHKHNFKDVLHRALHI